MNTIKKPAIVHESEAQRQHFRVPFPIKAQINGAAYDTKDLSSGGLSIVNIDGHFTAGSTLALELHFPFKNFEMKLDFEAEVLHHNTESKTLGCRFVNLDPDNTSLLNYVLKAYLAGDMISAGDLISITGRDNFVSARGQKANAPVEINWSRQIAGIGIIGIIGLFAAGLITNNLYQSLFIIKSQNAYVTGPVIDLRAPVAGFFQNALGADVITIQPGQKIATIKPTLATAPEIFGLESEIKSPCDCLISDSPHLDGEYLKAGDNVVSLIPVNASPWLKAEMQPGDAGRISLNDRANISIAGSDVDFTGRVDRIRSSMAENTSAIPSISVEGMPRPVQIRITPDQKIPPDLIGRPASISFSSQ